MLYLDQGQQRWQRQRGHASNGGTVAAAKVAAASNSGKQQRQKQKRRDGVSLKQICLVTGRRQKGNNRDIGGAAEAAMAATVRGDSGAGLAW